MTRDIRRLAAIVSADVAGYSRLMGRDESGTLATLKAHLRELIDPKIAEYGGRVVKRMGDGLLIEFPSVVDAVRCAVDVQRGMAERNTQAPDDRLIEFRIGINVGDIIIDGDDIFGDGVNVAARLQALAEPGGICVSRVVRDQVLDKLNFAFDDLGQKEVKNIARPVEVFRVALDPEPSAVPALHAASARRSAHPRFALVAAIVVGLLGASWLAFLVFLQPTKIAPYSAQDRRMTFAVLPYTSAAGDEAAARVAAAMTEATTAEQEARTLWAIVAPRASIAQAMQKHTSVKDLAKALDVHFLLRGNVTPAAQGYKSELHVVDGATERVLDTHTFAIPSGSTLPARSSEIDDALGRLTYRALEIEVDRARTKAEKDMDVRDLAFRAFVDWGRLRNDPKRAYVEASHLLDRALTLAPDDPLALYVKASTNLCDCVEGWSTNVAEQQAIGADALERFLRRRPDSIRGFELKANLLSLQGRFEESLVIADSILKRQPENAEALMVSAYDLLKLGRPKEALPFADNVLKTYDESDALALAAAIQYTLGDDERAAAFARAAIAKLSRDNALNGYHGAVALTLAAAEARRGQRERARAALAGFQEAVPSVVSIPAAKAWIKPTAHLAGYEPLFDGLRRAGLPD